MGLLLGRKAEHVFGLLLMRMSTLSSSFQKIQNRFEMYPQKVCFTIS